MKNLLKSLGGIVAGMAIVFAIATLVYLDYTAYRQRFPHAEPWTYFFRIGK